MLLQENHMHCMHVLPYCILRTGEELKKDKKYSEAIELVRLYNEQKKAGLIGDPEAEMVEINEEMEVRMMMISETKRKHVWEATTLNQELGYRRPLDSFPVKILRFLRKHGNKVPNEKFVFLLTEDWVYLLLRKKKPASKATQRPVGQSPDQHS